MDLQLFIEILKLHRGEVLFEILKRNDSTPYNPYDYDSVEEYEQTTRGIVKDFLTLYDAVKRWEELSYDDSNLGSPCR
jgi:hypothetical protein